MLHVSKSGPQLIPLRLATSLTATSAAFSTRSGARLCSSAIIANQSFSNYSRSSQWDRERLRRVEWSVRRNFPSITRSFTTTPACSKGKKHRNRENDGGEQEFQSKQSNSDSAPITEALGLNSLKNEIQRIQEKLKKSLSMLKPGGGFNPALIESLKVDMSKIVGNEQASEEKAKKAKSGQNKQQNPRVSHKVSLKDVAQVIPRGAKTVLIMLNEEDFVKPVTSALLNSPHSLNPQPSPNNPLELIVPIPPPSTQMRQLNIAQVDKYLERAELDLRTGRADMQKALRALSLDGRLRPDDHMKGQKDMEKVVDEAKKEIKRLCDASKKVLQ